MYSISSQDRSLIFLIALTLTIYCIWKFIFGRSSNNHDTTSDYFFWFAGFKLGGFVLIGFIVYKTLTFIEDAIGIVPMGAPGSIQEADNKKKGVKPIHSEIFRILKSKEDANKPYRCQKNITIGPVRKIKEYGCDREEYCKLLKSTIGSGC